MEDLSLILLALLLIVLFLWVSSQQKIKALEKQIKELNKQNEENAIECSNGNNRS